MELIKEKNRETDIKFFLDGNKKVILDFTQCFEKNLMLSQVRYLCDNVTELKEKDDGYYIGDYKYLEKNETKKYSDEAFNEIAKGFINAQTYLCLNHFGKYENINESYKKILEEIKSKKYKIVGIPTEQYINGSWNKNDETEYITKIMIPIKNLFIKKI